MTLKINGREYEVVAEVPASTFTHTQWIRVRTIRGVRGGQKGLWENKDGTRWLTDTRGNRWEQVREMTEAGPVLGYTISLETLLGAAK